MMLGIHTPFLTGGRDRPAAAYAAGHLPLPNRDLSYSSEATTWRRSGAVAQLDSVFHSHDGRCAGMPWSIPWALMHRSQRFSMMIVLLDDLIDDGEM